MLETSMGELPKSKPCGGRLCASLMQICPTPLSRNANASSIVLTMTSARLLSRAFKQAAD